MSLSDKFQEAFTDAKKMSILKDKREVEVFKLALQLAFSFNKQFIKDLKEEIVLRLHSGKGWCGGSSINVTILGDIIDKLAGKELVEVEE